MSEAEEHTYPWYTGEIREPEVEEPRFLYTHVYQPTEFVENDEDPNDFDDVKIPYDRVVLSDMGYARIVKAVHLGEYHQQRYDHWIWFVNDHIMPYDDFQWYPSFPSICQDLYEAYLEHVEKTGRDEIPRVKKTYMVLGDYDEKYPIEIDLDHNDFGIKHVLPRPKPEPIDEKTAEEIRAKQLEEEKKVIEENWHKIFDQMDAENERKKAEAYKAMGKKYVPY